MCRTGQRTPAAATRLVSVKGCLAGVIGFLLIAPGAFAQSSPPPPGPCAPQTPAAKSADSPGQEPASENERLLGVLPNYATVGPHQKAAPLCTKLLFTLAFKSAFDRNIYPFVGMRTIVAQLQHSPEAWDKDAGGFAQRYAAIFTDTAVSAFMTTAIVPMIARQDPRYYVRGEGSAWHRAAYAMTRTVITRGREGDTQFNISEIGGAGLAAVTSNAYYPSEDRSLSSVARALGNDADVGYALI